MNVFEDAPNKPHLALVTKDGRLMAIPLGTRMAIIENPNRVDGIFHMVLRKVTHNYFDFDTVSSDPKNTRRVRFRADWKGEYTSAMRDAAKLEEDKLRKG